MLTLRQYVLPIAAVLLLAFSPAYAFAGDDFEQDNPTPTPDEDDLVQENNPNQAISEEEDGVLTEEDPHVDAFDACTDGDYLRTEVCYVAERDEFWVLDKDRDGLGAIGYWYADLDDDGDTDGDPDDREGSCRNPHGVGTWAMCDVDFDEAGVPLHFEAGCTDRDNSEAPNSPRGSDDFPCSRKTETVETVT